MTKRHADDVTVADIVRLRKENEELQQRIRYQEHRDGAAKGKTHSIDCYGYGPSHYECALQEIERLQEDLKLERLREAFQELLNVLPVLPKDAKLIVGMEERYKKAVFDARAALKEGE